MGIEIAYDYGVLVGWDGQWVKQLGTRFVGVNRWNVAVHHPERRATGQVDPRGDDLGGSVKRGGQAGMVCLKVDAVLDDRHHSTMPMVVASPGVPIRCSVLAGRDVPTFEPR